MLRFVQNLRIGTKVAIASGFSIVLVCVMMYGQITGSAAVRRGYQSAVQQQLLAQLATETKASVRGMLLGIRDAVLSNSLAELRSATDYFVARQQATARNVAEMAQQAQSAEDQRLIAGLTPMIASIAKSRDQIGAIRGEIISLQAAAGELPDDAGPRIARLNDDIARIRKDVTLPLAAEMESLVEKVSVAGKTASQGSIAAATALGESVEWSGVALGVANLVVLIGMCFFSTFTIARPIRALSRAMLELANGNFGVVLPGLGRRDEIGEVAGAVETFKTKALDKATREAEAQRDQEHRAAEQRKAEMCALADEFEGAVGRIVEAVSQASAELEAAAGTLAGNAEHAQDLTAMVASASEEASSNVQSVASATEQMTSSVNEISRQVQDSALIANDAVSQARKTNDRVAALSVAANRIGDVVELINTIAGQTNLLALNATIEAARAGDAGRGFAVVASEVKALAEQTAKATGEISQQISGIQAATQESVAAIKEIGATINRMSEISSTIASAVEEQGAATMEISRNVQQAANGTQQVSANIADVQRGASETGSASAQVLSAAKSLSGDSARLQLELGKFLHTVRAA
jgi:methyl-accepting chemotaxis protein